MQLTMDLDEFNIFIMMYIKAVIHREINHKASLHYKITMSGVPEAELLFAERKQQIESGRWDTDKDKKFNDQLKVMIPDINLKNASEFDWFLDVIDGKNIDTWLIQHYFKQSPQLKTYIRRFAGKINSGGEVQVKLII